MQDLLGLLAVFAVANPKLFSSHQLITLQTYLQDDKSKEDMGVYYLLLIFKNVLPLIGTLNPKFLNEIQQALLKMLSKLNLRVLISK